MILHTGRAASQPPTIRCAHLFPLLWQFEGFHDFQRLPNHGAFGGTTERAWPSAVLSYPPLVARPSQARWLPMAGCSTVLIPPFLVVKHNIRQRKFAPDDHCTFHSDVDLPILPLTIPRLRGLRYLNNTIASRGVHCLFHRQRSRGGHRHPTLACPASLFRRGCLVLPNVKHRRLVPHIYQFPYRLLMVIPSARDRPCPEVARALAT
jgi:hypothetical protein